MEAKIMTKKQQNNHPWTGYLTEIRTMISGKPLLFTNINQNQIGGVQML